MLNVSHKLFPNSGFYVTISIISSQRHNHNVLKIHKEKLYRIINILYLRKLSMFYYRKLFQLYVWLRYHLWLKMRQWKNRAVSHQRLCHLLPTALQIQIRRCMPQSLQPNGRRTISSSVKSLVKEVFRQWVLHL